jgi:hypothetical protein
MKSQTILLAVFFLTLGEPFQSQRLEHKPGVSSEDRIRIAEAFRLADSVQNQIWTNWSKAPFGIMLITNEYEYLIGHPHATNNFDTLGYDSDLHRLVLFRKRLFPTNLLATFPAINGISTIVVGQAANTNVASSTAWVVTILHEHFHQYQQSQPDYYEATNALGLSKGDETGMWMLNYPFPYDSEDVDNAYGAMAHSLLEAISCRQSEQSKYLRFFLEALERFKDRVSPDDFKYFSFQCWQEGVARYTELQIASLAASGFTPSIDFRSLKDYKPFREVADSIRSRIVRELAHPSLQDSRRVAFYALGAGEALLLDRVRPDWKGQYLNTEFSLEKLFPR